MALSHRPIYYPTPLRQGFAGLTLWDTAGAPKEKKAINDSLSYFPKHTLTGFVGDGGPPVYARGFRLRFTST